MTSTTRPRRLSRETLAGQLRLGHHHQAAARRSMAAALALAKASLSEAEFRSLLLAELRPTKTARQIRI